MQMTTIPDEIAYAQARIECLSAPSKAILSRLLRLPDDDFTRTENNMLQIRVLHKKNYAHTDISNAGEQYDIALRAYEGFLFDCLDRRLLNDQQITLQQDEQGYLLSIDRNALNFLRNNSNALLSLNGRRKNEQQRG